MRPLLVLVNQWIDSMRPLPMLANQWIDLMRLLPVLANQWIDLMRLLPVLANQWIDLMRLLLLDLKRKDRIVRLVESDDREVRQKPTEETNRKHQQMTNEGDLLDHTKFINFVETIDVNVST